MKKVTIYTIKYCPYCDSAKRLFKSKNVSFEEILVAENDDATWARLERETKFKTMPQIFIDGKFVGGYQQVSALNDSGELDRLLA